MASSTTPLLADPDHVANANSVPPESAEPETQRPQGPEKLPENLLYILTSLWTSSFLCAADSTIVSTTANVIAASMNGSDKITWMATSYLLANAVFQPVIGRVSDIYGRRSVLIASQICFAVGCAWCAAAPTVTQFAIARAFAGAGGGCMATMSTVIVTDIMPLHLRGLYQGYANLNWAVGQFAGPVIGSFFLAAYPGSGWRWMFGLQVPLVVVVIVMAQRTIKEYYSEERKKSSATAGLRQIDLPGSFILALLITAIITLFQATSKTAALTSLLGAVLAGLAFFIVERYVCTTHVIPSAAFRGVLRILAIIAFFGTMSVIALNFLYPLYIQNVHDFSSFQIGVFNAFGVFSSAAGSLLAGFLTKAKSDAKPQEVVAKAVRATILSCFFIFLGATIGLVTTVLVPPTISRASINYFKIAPLATSYILSSIGFGSFIVAILVLVVGEVGRKNQAIVTGMNYMFRSMGSTSGVGTSLGLYNLVLSKKLYNYFVVRGLEHGQKYYDKLLKSSLYLRSGLPAEYIVPTLFIYKRALVSSMLLVFAVGVITLALALLVRIYVKSGRKTVYEF